MSEKKETRGRKRKPRPVNVVLNKRGTEKKTENGRPPVILDIAKLKSYVAIGCTDEEIACLLGVALNTYRTYKNEEPYKSIIASTTITRKASLRRKQYMLAMAGNVTMLVWLGKTELKQSDRLILQTKPISEWTEDEIKDAIRQAGGDPEAVARSAGAGVSTEAPKVH